MTVVVSFLDEHGNLVGRDTCPYPPGAVRVEISYAMLETDALALTPADEGRLLPFVTLTDEELAAEPWLRRTDPLLPHQVGPSEGAITFGPDEREIALPWKGAADDRYPLLSTCRCGRQIMQERSGVPWQHTD